MNPKIMAVVMIVFVLAITAFLITRPLGNKGLGGNGLDPKEENSVSFSADQAFQDWQSWIADSSPSLSEQERRLNELNGQFPEDYRFQLERVRGAANVKGVHSHQAEFEILQEAARTAIECDCGDAKKMLEDLLANRNNKDHGFWKLSTHPRQWNPIVEALRKENVELLEQIAKHGH